jgi:uncharacterized protein
MSPEEKSVIGGIFERLKGAATTQRDAEAEKFIADQIKLQPYAPYVMAQSIYAQEQALTAQQQQISQLQAQVQQFEQYAQQVQQQQSQGSGGFLGGLFGGGARQTPPPPQLMAKGPMGQSMGNQPGYGQQAPGPWGQQPGGPAPGPWGQQAQPQQRGGMGFLGTAAMTAAGVAGGMLAANALTSMFSGSKDMGQSASAAGTGAAAEAPASHQPASYEEPGNGSYAQEASYDDGSSYDGGGGDDWA